MSSGGAAHAARRRTNWQVVGLPTLTGCTRFLNLKTKKYSMTQTTEHPYIVTDDQILGGEPIVKDTRTPVRAIVEIWRLGTPPEDIPNHLPHLSLGQVLMP